MNMNRSVKSSFCVNCSLRDSVKCVIIAFGGCLELLNEHCCTHPSAHPEGWTAESALHCVLIAPPGGLSPDCRRRSWWCWRRSTPTWRKGTSAGWRGCSAESASDRWRRWAARRRPPVSWSPIPCWWAWPGWGPRCFVGWPGTCSDHPGPEDQQWKGVHCHHSCYKCFYILHFRFYRSQLERFGSLSLRNSQSQHSLCDQH